MLSFVIYTLKIQCIDKVKVHLSWLAQAKCYGEKMLTSIKMFKTISRQRVVSNPKFGKQTWHNYKHYSWQTLKIQRINGIYKCHEICAWSNSKSASRKVEVCAKVTYKNHITLSEAVCFAKHYVWLWSWYNNRSETT